MSDDGGNHQLAPARRKTMARWSVTLSLALLVAAGCSARDDGTDVRTDAPEATWERQLLPGDPGADYETQVAVDGDAIVVATATDEGELRSYYSGADGRFVAGEPQGLGLGYPGVGALTRFGDRWIALGGSGTDVDGPTYRVRVLSSADGLAWTAVEATGFDQAAEPSGAVTSGGRLVAVGTLRTAEDPSNGGFLPVAWHTEDGERWTQVDLPTGGASEGGVQDVARVGEQLVATGQLQGRGTMWSSADDGQTWSISRPSGLPEVNQLGGVVTDGEVALVSAWVAVSGQGDDGEGGEVLLLRSADGGRSWTEASTPPPGDDAEGFPSPVFAGGGWFFALSYSSVDAWRSPELCYADIELCRQDRGVDLYASEDGDVWDRIDTSDVGEDGELDSITGAADGRVVGFRRGQGGTEAWTWPAGQSLPLAGPVAPLPTAEVDLLEEGEEPVVGRRYGVPLYIHCGMDWLYVAAEPWSRTDGGSDIETGAGDSYPDDWPGAGQTIYGYVTLVDEDTLEYSIGDGEVIATYERAIEEPPGCA